MLNKVRFLQRWRGKAKSHLGHEGLTVKLALTTERRHPNCSHMHKSGGGRVANSRPASSDFTMANEWK